MFTLLLVIRAQRYMWSLDKVGCIAKSSQQSFCHWWQNIHYHLTNLQNHITSNIFVVVSIITSKQQIFSVRSSLDPSIVKIIVVQSSPVRPKLASVRMQSDPVLIRAHLWCFSLMRQNKDTWFYVGGSGLDRIQFLWSRIGLGLKNFTVRSSLL